MCYFFCVAWIRSPKFRGYETMEWLQTNTYTGGMISPCLYWFQKESFNLVQCNNRDTLNFCSAYQFGVPHCVCIRELALGRIRAKPKSLILARSSCEICHYFFYKWSSIIRIFFRHYQNVHRFEILFGNCQSIFINTVLCCCYTYPMNNRWSIDCWVKRRVTKKNKWCIIPSCVQVRHT